MSFSGTLQRVAGKSALVTGAASGIGRATACLLARHGAAVVCADVNLDGVNETVSMIESSGVVASGIRLDVTKEEDWIAGTNQATKSNGRLDILAHSAGIAHGKPVVDMTLYEWRHLFAINLDGVFLGTKHAIRTMRDTGGSIVLVSSAVAHRPAAGSSSYSTSKAAVCTFARVAAKECADAGLAIRINTVCPGGVKTPLWRTQPFFQELIEKTGSEEAAFKAMVGDKPGARFIEPEEVALAILYLASDESQMVTGTDLVIDAGYSI